MKPTTISVCLLVLASAAGTPAQAVTDEDIYASLRISLTPPGARAAGMGGAAIAWVDDAAASRINPARLASLTAPQALFEGRHRDYDSFSGGTHQIRFDPMINPYAGTTFSSRSSPEGGAVPALLSFAYPLPFAASVVLGVSRSEVLDLTSAASSVTRTVPLSAPQTPSGGDEVLRVSRGTLDMKVELYDLSAGWRLAPTLSVGGSLVVGRLDLSSATTGLLADPLQLTGPGMSDPRFDSGSTEPLVRTVSDGSDTDLAYSFGVSWKALQSLTLATAYRRGARFEVPGSSLDLVTRVKESFSNVVKLPDAAVVGVAWTRGDLTLALDVERVENSDLLEGMREGENVLTRSDFVRRVSYDLQDATEARLGLEHRRSYPTWTLALRGGAYTEHDSRIDLRRISGDVGALQGQSQAMSQGDFFPEGQTQLHVTMGAGARFHNLSVDFGIDLSDPLTQVAAAATYSFR